jgi:DNA modification methylase
LKVTVCLQSLHTYSEQNDLVFDPFLGNGEVLRVSKELKRRYIGIDLDSVRVEIAKGLSLYQNHS